METERRAFHAVVFGRVQGVSFRFYTQSRAKELNIVGWVRNLPDGSVEVMAEGSRVRLEQLKAFLERGPQAARVTHLELEWRVAHGQFDDFEVH
ncbi:MAG: acylphosphatase [Anaerolineae bacterium]